MTDKDQINTQESNNDELKKIVSWSFEHDELLSNWGDHAVCYTWMHDATQRKFSKINMWLGVPVIILSTISGTANFGISTIFPPGFNYGNAIIGTLSLITGVISTVANFLGYAQAEEAHRISGIQWSKFRRTIDTELSLHPDERQAPGEFIKHSRAELDRLMEQSPIIPQDIINKFIKTFRKVKNVKMPEICNKLEPTTIYSELFDLRKTTLENKNIDATVITTTDKSIIKSVGNKINSFFSSSSKPEATSASSSKNTESENNDVIVTIKKDEDDEDEEDKEENKNIINYSNASPKILVKVEEASAEVKDALPKVSEAIPKVSALAIVPKVSALPKVSGLPKLPDPTPDVTKIDIEKRLEKTLAHIAAGGTQPKTKIKK
jgi:hypothetical protein